MLPLLINLRNNMIAFKIWHPKLKCSDVVFSENPKDLKSLNVNLIFSKISKLDLLHIKIEL